MKIVNDDSSIQGSQAWLDKRNNCVGASEVASIHNVKGAFQTKIQTLNAKLYGAPALSDFTKKMFADGHEIEITIRDYLNQNGWNFIPCVCVHPENDRFLASLDGYDAEKRVILEAKSVMSRAKFEDYKKKVPGHYYAQVQWQMYVTGVDHVLIAFYHAGDMHTEIIHSDPIYYGALKDSAYRFLDELDECRTKLKDIAPISNETSLEISRIASLKQIEKDMKAQLKTVEAEVKTLASELLKLSGGFRVENSEMIIEMKETKGRIDYDSIPELKDVDLEKYRKKPTSNISVKLTGEKE